MNILERNLNFLQNNIPEIFHRIVNEKDQYGVKVDRNASELAPLVLRDSQKIFYHSVYSKVREYERLALKIDVESESLIIFGCISIEDMEGYFSRFTKLKRLLIIEPSRNVFIYFLSQIDLARFDFLEELAFAVNQPVQEVGDICVGFIKRDFQAKLSIVSVMYAKSLYGEYNQRLHKRIMNSIRDLRIKLTTVRSTVEAHLVNGIANLFVPGAKSIDEIYNSIKGKHVVIVSAGPSLGNNTAYFEELKKKAVVIAVGSAVQIMNSHGIQPHFRFFFDPFDNNMPIFESISNDYIPLVYSNAIYYQIPPKYQGPKYWMVVDSENIAKYASKLVGKNPKVFKSNFSIASVAHDFVLKAKAKSIMFIGQDLSFASNKRYSSGSWNDDETFDFSQSHYIPIINNLGEKAFTNISYLGMKNQLEIMITENPEIPHYNTSIGGAYIEGAKHMSMTQYLELIEDSQLDESFLEDLFQSSEDGFTCDESEVLLKELKSQINQIESLVVQKWNLLKQNENGIHEENEIEKYRELDAKLDEVSFYNQVLSKEFIIIFQAFEISFGANGNTDMGKQYDYHLALTTEIMKYMITARKIVEHIEDKLF